jgi:hypothetical protein
MSFLSTVPSETSKLSVFELFNFRFSLLGELIVNEIFWESIHFDLSIECYLAS